MLEIIQSPSKVTREQWLIKATVLLTPLFKAQGYCVPSVRVSTGFTGSRSGYKAIGACWSPKAAKDNVAQIFISPVISESLRVLDVLTHELCHAVVGNDQKHNKVFKRCAISVGLTGKMTSTVATPDLTAKLAAIVTKLGEYPHAMLTPSLSGVKKQGTRMLKACCADCGYTVRITRTWADYGLPKCPSCETVLVLVLV